MFTLGVWVRIRVRGHGWTVWWKLLVPPQRKDEQGVRSRYPVPTSHKLHTQSTETIWETSTENEKVTSASPRFFIAGEAALYFPLSSFRWASPSIEEVRRAPAARSLNCDVSLLTRTRPRAHAHAQTLNGLLLRSFNALSCHILNKYVPVACYFQHVCDWRMFVLLACVCFSQRDSHHDACDRLLHPCRPVDHLIRKNTCQEDLAIGVSDPQVALALPCMWFVTWTGIPYGHTGSHAGSSGFSFHSSCLWGRGWGLGGCYCRLCG